MRMSFVRIVFVVFAFLLFFFIIPSSFGNSPGLDLSTVQFTGLLEEGKTIHFKIFDTAYNSIKSITPESFTLHFDHTVKTQNAKFSDRFNQWLTGRGGRSLDPFEGCYYIGTVTVTYNDQRVGSACTGNQCHFQVLVDPSLRNLMLRSGDSSTLGAPPFYPSFTLYQLPPQEAPKETVVHIPYDPSPGSFGRYLIFYRREDGAIAHVVSTTSKMVITDIRKNTGAIQSFAIHFIDDRNDIPKFLGKNTYTIEEIQDNELGGFSVKVKNVGTGKTGIINQNPALMAELILRQSDKPLIFKKIGQGYIASTSLPGGISLRVEKLPCKDLDDIKFCLENDDCFKPHDVILELSEGFLKSFYRLDNQLQIRGVRKVFLAGSEESAPPDVPDWEWNTDACLGDVNTQPSSQEESLQEEVSTEEETTTDDLDDYDPGVSNRQPSQDSFQGTIQSSCDEGCSLRFVVNTFPHSFLVMEPLCLFGVAKKSPTKDLGAPVNWVERYLVVCNRLKQGYSLSFQPREEGVFSAYLFAVDANFLPRYQEPHSDMSAFFYTENPQEIILVAEKDLPVMSGHDKTPLNVQKISQQLTESENPPVDTSPEEPSPTTELTLQNGVVITEKEDAVEVSWPDKKLTIKDTHPDELKIETVGKYTRILLPKEKQVTFSREEERAGAEMKLTTDSELIITDADYLVKGGFTVTVNGIESSTTDGVFAGEGLVVETKKPFFQQSGEQLTFENIDGLQSSVKRETTGGLERLQGSAIITTSDGDEIISAGESSASLELERSIPLSKKNAHIQIKDGRVKVEVRPQKNHIGASAPRTYQFQQSSQIVASELPSPGVAITVQDVPEGVRIASNKLWETREVTREQESSQEPAKKEVPIIASHLSTTRNWRLQLLAALGPSWNSNSCPPQLIQEDWYRYAEEARQEYKGLTHNKQPISLSLIFGVMCQESALGTKLQSPKGALGIMQIVPITAGIDVLDPTKRTDILHVLRTKYGRTDLPDISCANPKSCSFVKTRQYRQLLFNDPQVNIFAGVAYLSWLDGFRGVDGDIEKVLQAYNSGIGNLLKGKSCHLDETINYVNKICYQFGLSPLCFGHRTGSICCQENHPFPLCKT